jgi:hypothetical protein
VLKPSDRDFYRKQLLHQRSAMFAGHAHLPDVTLRPAVFLQLLDQQVAVEHDAGQQIVEVVSHSSHQPAHSFEGLRFL